MRNWSPIVLKPCVMSRLSIPVTVKARIGIDDQDSRFCVISSIRFPVGANADVYYPCAQSAAFWLSPKIVRIRRWITLAYTS